MGGVRLFLLLLVFVARVDGGTITVTKAMDWGEGSLRQAILDAEDGDTIGFDPGSLELTGSFAAVDQPFESLGTFVVEVDEVNDRVTLSFDVTGTASFADFQRLWFTDEQIANGDAEPEADFDRDGTGTFLEWIYGRNPIEADAQPGGVVVELTPGGDLELTFPRARDLPAAVQVAVQSSVNGGNWPVVPGTDYAELAGVPIAGRPEVELVTIRITNAALLADAERLFRLEFRVP